MCYEKGTITKMKTNWLLISFKTPHKQVGIQTISMWLKIDIKEAGLEEQYIAHSTRHASTSKAHFKDFYVKMIKSAAG